MRTQADLLETLLGKPEEAYSSTGEGRPRIVLYGAGTHGRAVLERLRAAGAEPVAFADDTPSKQGQLLDGLQILSPEKIAARFGSHVVFAVTILNPTLRFLNAEKRIRRRTGCEVWSLLALARRFPDALLPYLQYDRPGQILKNASHIRRAFETFSDDESRQQFVAHLNFRLNGRYDLLPVKSEPAYFPRDLIAQFSSDSTFVDCGAYDGDTIRQFLRHQGGRFGTIVAFEPDRHNYESLTAYVRSLGTDVASRIHLYHGAVGERSGEAPFDETGDMSAAVRPDATGKVALFALDDVVRPEAPDIYVKFDIEGFELPALAGARSLLRTRRPTLAVSAYHRPGDLWEIPLYLHDLDIGYRLALRTEGDDGMDVVCYALPAASNPATLA
jgi:FkbM family methyltransferase